MSWLSKGAKSVAAVASPLTAGFASILGYGSSPGQANPYAPPNLAFLQDPSKFDFLKTLGDKTTKIGSTDNLFQDLLTNIGGQNQNDTAALNNLLADIGIDEKNTVGATKSDFLDRGLGGPGQISDIEANAIAQNRSMADRTRTGARVDTVGKGLDRLATAYGQRYATGASNAATDAATYNDLLKSGNLAYANLASGRETDYAKILSDLYSGGEKNKIDTMQPGYLDSFLRNIKLGIGVGK